MAIASGRRGFAGVVLALAAVGALPVAAAPASAATGGAHALRLQIRQAFRGATARNVDWRFDISGEPSLRQAASRSTAPASNNKLLIGETALQRLGPDYVYRTDVEATGSLNGSTLRGALVVRGSGDPLLDDAALATLARQVRLAGVVKVTGGLIVADGRYEHRTTAPGWKPGFTPAETGPVDAFAVDENGWKRTASYVAKPAVANANRFRGVLRAHGVYVHGTTRVASPPGPTTPLTHLDSQPLSAIVDEMLTNSDNFVAEMVLDELGAARGSGGTRLAGLRVVRQESGRLHAPVGVVEDGSGLSYADRESPDALVGWLQAVAASSTGTELRAGLAVACRTGTLKDRLCGRSTKGKVQAKTGTLDRVRALSGYATTASGRAVTFSILLSGIRNMTAAERRIDAAVRTVARWQG